MLPAAEVLAATKLSKTQIVTIYRIVLGYTGVPEGNTLGYGETALFWLMDALLQSGLIRSDGLALVAKKLHQPILKYSPMLAAAVAQPPGEKLQVPIFHVGIADRRYFTCDGEEQLFAIETGEPVDASVKTRAVETIVYNLTQLYLAHLHALRERKFADVKRIAERASSTRLPSDDPESAAGS
jgi:hypothetical protein